jgi:NADH-quinone oxidoreductase subunit M
MTALPLLSLAIWVPIIAGILVLLTGDDKNAAIARWVALLGACCLCSHSSTLYQF